MKIGGLQKTSTIDYPGQLTAILFTQGCNLKCPYCHNPELISLDKDNLEFDKEKFFGFLEKRKEILDAVTITGGEPTLQKDLISFIREIKDMGYLVKLDTNGLKPIILIDLIKEDLLDYIAMDIKLPIEDYEDMKTQKSLEDIIENLKLSINTIIKHSKCDYEFRTTIVPGLHDQNNFERTVKEISEAQNYYIQNFRPNKTLNKSFEEKRRFTDKELKEFELIAKKYVKNVYIRN
jgi:pyruvate formate lyase activating enzyme